MVLVVQSVRISNKIPKQEADKMVRKMGYKPTPISKNNNPQYKNYHSYRQIDPKKFKKNTFRIKRINPSTFFVLGHLASS